MKERAIVSFDYAVKYLLRDKADFGILSGFLSELLERDVEVQAILESETNKDKPEGRTNRVDMKAQIDGREIAVFEIQFRETVDFFSRVLFGVSKAITEQVSSGSEVYDVKKVYSINIAYYNFDAKREYLFCCKLDGFKGVNFPKERIRFEQACDVKKQRGPKTDILPVYYLILPNKFSEKRRGGFNEWMYVLKNSAVRSSSTAQGTEEASRKLDYLKMSPEEKRAYEEYCNRRGSVMSAIDFGVQEGHAKGLAEVHVKGKAEGLAEGNVKGRAERQAEIAKELKLDGMPAEKIAKMTRLSVDEVNKL